jgi:hypothetical protein
MKARWLLISAIFPRLLHASKETDDLRARNAALEKALSVAVQQAGEGTKGAAAQSSAAHAASTGRQVALDTAANNARAALSDSARHAAESRAAEIKAEEAARIEATRLDELKSISDRNLGANLLGFLVIIIGGVGNAWNTMRSRMKSDAHQVETKAAIKNLAKNTDGIREALVKTTGEAEFAKGVIVGAETGDPTAQKTDFVIKEH